MYKNVISALFLCVAHVCTAQYFQFSQYNFTPQRVNPAQVADSDYASVTLDYRNQATDGGFHLTSNLLNISYPLMAKNGKRWSGVGLSFMDDRSGQAGFFNTQEVGASYAVNVSISKFETISLGVRGVYQSRKIDLGGLVTGAQYVPDRGFNEALASGENLGQFKTDYTTFSAGLHWQRADDNNTRLAYAGVSFFDFNKPRNSFFDGDSELNTTFVASGGFRVFQRANLGIFPEVLFTRSAANNVLNVGLVTRYDLVSENGQDAHVDIITKYVPGRSGIIGLQFFKDNFIVGISYDFPVFVTNVANTGAFEIALGLRKLVVPPRTSRNKKKRQERRKPPTVQSRPSQKPVGKSQSKDTLDSRSAAHTDTVRQTIMTKSDTVIVKQKQDSVIANAGVGQFKHEPLILERATLRFTFDFNSAAVNTETARYLDDLAKALIDNPALKIKLVGHTDNIGSRAFNLKLSIQRANVMKAYLVRMKVDPERIAVEGRGREMPLNDNSTEQQRALNRRVELTIMYDH